MKQTVMGIGAGALAVGSALATPVIANDTFDGLPSLGSQIGSFLTNMVPGVIAIVFALAVIGAIVAIFMAVAHRIGGAVAKK
jgi:hypothetical protein